MRRLLAALLLLTACGSADPPAPAPLPEWDLLPAGISAALCQHLQLEGIGTIGTEVAIVKVTQPIASAQVLARLGKPRRDRVVRIVHKALPIETVSGGTGGCSWKPIDALDPARQHDAMVVELSAPVGNPAARTAAGIVARASLGGTHPNWYWIELIPTPAGWAVGRILPLAI